MAQESQNKTTGRPFQVVEETWSVDTAEHWVFRSYLPQTLAGVIRSLFDAAEQSEMELGIAYVPRSMQTHLKWWPETAAGESTLLISNEKGEWTETKQTFNGRSQVGRDLWMLWHGKQGCALAVATRATAQRAVKIDLPETWQLRMSWFPDNVGNAVGAMKSLLKRHKVLYKQLTAFEEKLDSDRTPSKEIDMLIRSSLTLADHIDPWTRKQLTTTSWIQLYNRVQERVGWELMVDRLMPSIADVLYDTIGYDFFELLIFSRVGKRYEEFLSYRRNMTDFGGQSINLLLDARLVEEVIEEQQPRVIGTTREEGLMNPHLAQLALLQEGLIVPLVHEKHVHGMISLYFQEHTALTEVELENITHVGQVLARSIENTNAHETVRRLATIDGLTGLYNRRSFTDMISREMRRILRYKQHFSLILLDIDNFKNYNDNNGHLMGDKLLTKFAQVLKTSVREQDMVARYGGEEFAVILPHTDAERGMVVAEKIRQAVASGDFPHAESQPLGYISVSAGIADTIESVKTYQELIDRADRALYRAKESGRDRSLKYSPELDSDS